MTARRARALIAGLRASLLLGIACLIVDPFAAANRTAHGKPPLLLLLDTSASMSAADVPGGRTRLAAASALAVGAGGLAPRLSPAYDVRSLPFAAGLTGVAGGAQGQGTDIGAALRQAAAQLPQGARAHVVVVSDGRDTSGGPVADAARDARARGLTVSTVTFGALDRRPRVRVALNRARLACLRGDAVTLAGEALATGSGVDRVTVTLLRDGRVTARQECEAAGGAFRFAVRPGAAGSVAYTVRAAAGVASAAADATVDVAPGPARVLLLAGAPTWDGRSVARALRGDSALAVDWLTRLTPGQVFASTASGGGAVALPRTAADLAPYDVVLLGSAVDGIIDAQMAAALRAWVSDGGAVLFLGTPGTLQPICPLDYRGGTEACAAGRMTPDAPVLPGIGDVGAILPAFPASPASADPLAAVLARGDDAAERPVLAVRRVGEGTVAAIAGEGTWRWTAASARETASEYMRLYRALVRGLALQGVRLPGRAAGIAADRPVYAPGESVRLTVRSRSGDPGGGTVRIQRRGGRPFGVPTGASTGSCELSASLQAADPGRYSAAYVARGRQLAMCSFVVRHEDAEGADISADPALMQRIAAAGGGIAVDAADADRLVARLRTDRMPTPRLAEARSRWDRPWVLALLAGLFVAELALRRKAGLP